MCPSHFFCWDISVICPIIVLQLAVTLIYVFGHYDRTDLIIFGHLINNLDRKNEGNLNVHCT